MEHRCIRTIHAVIVFFFLAATVSISGELFSNGRQYGMAGAYSALVRGAEATFTNPANLGLPAQHPYSISFFGAATELSNSAFAKSYYDRYNGDFLDASEIQDILSQIPLDGIAAEGWARLHGLGISRGPWALAVNFTGGMRTSVAREFFELALEGNELNRDYTFEPFKGRALNYTSLGVGYGKAFKFDNGWMQQLNLGVTAALHRGMYYFEISEASAHTQTTYSDIEAEGNVSVRTADGGWGGGVNVAATATLFGSLRTSLVLENAWSTMTWSRSPQRHDYGFRLLAHQADALMEDDVNWEEVVDQEKSKYPVEAFRAALPRILHLGLMRPVGAELFLTGELEMGFSESALSSTKPRLSVGGEYWPSSFFQARAGFAAGGVLRPAFSGGIGLRVSRFCIDLAARSYQGITPATSQGFGAAVSLSYR